MGESCAEIVGVGACTPVGATAVTTAASVRARISRLQEHPVICDQHNEPVVVGRAAYLPTDLSGPQRLVALASRALQEALASLEELTIDIPAIPVFLGLPSHRPGLPEGFAAEVASLLADAQKGGPVLSKIRTTCKGHSAGLMAIEQAVRLVNQGEVPLCVAGGVDSYVDPLSLGWLDETERLLCNRHRSAFVPGEGGGFCFVASSEAVQRLGLKSLGKVVRVATEQEENLRGGQDVNTGTALTAAVRRVVQPLVSSDSKIDHTICDLNGERQRTDEWGFTLTRTGRSFADPSNFFAPTLCWGDVGAASGPLFVNLTLAAAMRGYAQGPYTLLWTSSDSGKCSAALIQCQTEGL